VQLIKPNTTLAAKGELSANGSGQFTALNRLANSLNDETNPKPPTVLIETKTRSIVVKDYDTMTLVIKCVANDR
jgi:hypothetical protein